jgi:glucokinase
VSADTVLAIDIGGTKLAAARFDPAAGVLTERAERPTDGTDAEGLWHSLRDLLDQVTGGQPVAAVGAGCGGPMRWPEGAVSPLNIPGWRGFPLRDRLRATFPDRPVVVHNDAIVMALGEYRYGAGRGTSSFLGVVVSTGVGAGLVVDGRPLFGPSGNAGHLGHVVVAVDGPACSCGGRGCLEAVARGPALVAWAVAQGWRPPHGVADGRALTAAARAGDPIALAALTRGGQALGVALASAAAMFDLDAVAVGGGIAGSGELLLGPARAAFRRHAQLDFTRRCRVVLAEHGNDAGLLGAGALAAEALERGAD